MTSNLIPVPVPGAAPLMAMHDTAGNWASLRHMCDTLGVDLKTQIEKLNRRSWATVGLRPTVAEDGKLREMLMLHADSVPMWLATIDENRVNPESRPRLIAYQREAAKALADYFGGKTVTAPNLTTLDGIRALCDQLEAAQRDAAEARQIAQRSEARLDGIEGHHDWFSALGYARANGLPTYQRFVARLGRHAAMIARTHGIAPDPVQHAHYGTVNSLPAWIWDMAAEGMASA